MEPSVIYQDGSILVLNKPSGWIVNSAGTTTNQPVVQKWLKDNFNYPASSDDLLRSGIVHRIDKETSGILLIATSGETLINLQQQFKERKVEKKYLALVHGKVQPGEGTVDAPVGRLPWRRDRFGVLAGGREAKTDYRVKQYYQNEVETFSLMEAMPKTGRTHQIRIHFKYLNHPLVADEFYAGRKTARNDRKWCPRLFLHASEITFKHPIKGNRISFLAELPPDLKQALGHLKAS